MALPPPSCGTGRLGNSLIGECDNHACLMGLFAGEAGDPVKQPCGARGLGIVGRWSLTFPQPAPPSPSCLSVSSDVFGFPHVRHLVQDIFLLSLAPLVSPFS